MSSPLSLLAVDIGGESGRVLAGNWNGKSLSLSTIHRFDNGPVQLHNSLRWDLLHLWNNIRDSLQIAASHTQGEIRSIGVDTWAIDYVLLSKSGEWLGLPFCYRDPRTSGLIDEVCSRIEKKRLFASSGLQFLEINTLYQLYAASKHSPEILKAAHKFLMIPDWIHHALCGASVCEFTNASTTQFLHPTSRSWSTDILGDLNIPSHFLPEIVQPGTSLGRVFPNLLPPKSRKIEVIAPATHDTASAVVAVPTTRTGTASWAYISSGTWSLVGVELPAAALTDSALKHNLTNEAGVDGTYRLLKNVSGMWLLQQLKADLALKNSPLDYSQLIDLASKAPPLQSLINGDDPRFSRPGNFIEKIHAFCAETSQPIPSSPGQLARCILESLALSYSRVIQQLEEVTQTPIEVIHIVGGGSKNALLNQLTANACNRPVIAGPSEATAIGNLLIQARASGEIDSLRQIREIVRTSFAAELSEYLPQKSRLTPRSAPPLTLAGRTS